MNETAIDLFYINIDTKATKCYFRIKILRFLLAILYLRKENILQNRKLLFLAEDIAILQKRIILFLSEDTAILQTRKE